MALDRIKADEPQPTAYDEHVQRVARGYLALTHGDAWAALLMLAADRAVDQEALAQAHQAVSHGYVRAAPERR